MAISPDGKRLSLQNRLMIRRRFMRWMPKRKIQSDHFRSAGIFIGRFSTAAILERREKLYFLAEAKMRSCLKMKRGAKQG
ncbi:hypothetical protein PO124_28145 [Bacillus licheniformis]|nr:hypothetical protein [Bacillus licheniformis]